MTPEEYIRNLHLHDVPLDSIQFDLRNACVIISYAAYDEGINDYHHHTLTFCEAKEIVFDAIDPHFPPDEITYAEVRLGASGLEAELLFLSDSGGPSYTLRLKFTSIKEMSM
jgi:hypothetical protein